MTGKEYQNLAMRTNDGGSESRLKNAIHTSNVINIADLLVGAIGLCGEAGEVCEQVKKGVFHAHGLNPEQITKELGDVMWYVAMCCDALRISLDDVMKGNIDKLRKRYPDGFSTDASIHREEYQND